MSNKSNKLQRSYVSEIDQFLAELEQIPGVKSESRMSEERKYERIFDLRDNVKPTQTKEWLDDN